MYKLSTYLPTFQPTNQPINQRTKQTNKQPTNQPATVRLSQSTRLVKILNKFVKILFTFKTYNFTFRLSAELPDSLGHRMKQSRAVPSGIRKIRVEILAPESCFWTGVLFLFLYANCSAVLHTAYWHFTIRISSVFLTVF